MTLTERIRAMAGGEGLAGLLARGAAGSFAVRVGGAGLAFATQIVLTRLLGEDSYGRYIYAFTWMSFAAIFGAFGFGTAAVRFVAEYAGQQAWDRLRAFVAYGRRVVLAASVGAGAVLAASAWVVVPASDADLRGAFVVAGLMLPLWTSLLVHGAVLQGLKRVVRGQAPAELVRPALLAAALLVAILVLGRDVGATGAMALNAGATAAALGLALWWVRRGVPRGAREVVTAGQRHGWLHTARDMVLIASFTVVLFQADTLMLGALAGTTQAGLYAVASRVAGLLTFVLVAVNAILSPVVADLHGRGEHALLQRALRRGAQAVAAGTLVLAVGLVVLDEFVLGLFGEAFMAGRPALWVLVGGQLANALAGPAVMLLNMTGHQGTSARILGASAAANVVLNAVLIPAFGLVGAAAATTATMLLWNLLAVRAVLRTLHVNPTAFARPPR